MSSLEKARETQLRNIEAKTGRSLDELRRIVQKSGLKKHGDIRAMLMRELGLGYGDANSLVFFALQSDGQSAAEAKGDSLAEVSDEIYSGRKAALRPIHDRLLASVSKFGPFEVVPKKGYVSLRRKKQFAMVGPATVTAVEIGLNVKDLPPAGRLVALPPGGMCQYRVRIGSTAEVDKELLEWIKRAYESAG